MASLWKDTRSQYWVACFTDHAGRRLKKSTRLTDRRKAQKAADLLEQVARNKQAAKRLRESLAGLAKEIWDVDTPSTTVRAFFTTWLAEKKSSAAPSTIDFYTQSTDKFLHFLGANADEPIEDLERGVIVEFRSQLAVQLAAKTANHHIKCLRMILKSARRDGLVDDNAAEFVETIRVSSASERRPFTKAELQRVLQACDTEWKSMTLCAIYTGQRLADIATLKWEAINFDAAELRLTTRKTKKNLILPLAPPLLEHLKKLQPHDARRGPIHPNAYAVVEKQSRSGTLSNQFTKILVTAGLRDKSSLNKQSTGKGRSSQRAKSGLSFHSLRHTAVTLLKEAGIPQAVVMELIGHDSEQMSQHYTHVGQEALKKAAEALPDFTTSMEVPCPSNSM